MSSSYAREYRALLRDNGLCIQCKREHEGPSVRCPECAEINRGGPRLYPDPVAILKRLEEFDTKHVPESVRRSVNYKRWYWRKKVKSAA